MSHVNTTKQWLSTSHILVPDDWLQACVDWIQEENQGVAPAQDALNSQVYEQWLLSDLHELETHCLPHEAATATKLELNGAYALQVDSILDVGKSFYSQQQKYQGTENANTRVSAEEPEVKPWEMKPTRMLKMVLTDGQQTVQGMEYRPITSLTPQTPPGSKIIVHGDILCRHGVLMLSEAQIKFLGGEVDTLVEANTILNTLQAAMDASVENADKHARQEFSGSEIIPSQKPTGSQLQGRAGQSRPQPAGSQLGRSTKPDIKHQPYGSVKTEIRTQTSHATQNRPDNSNIPVDNEWDDDEELMDAFMEDMDMNDFDELATSSVTTATARNTAGTRRGSGLTGSSSIGRGATGGVDGSESRKTSLSRNLKTDKEIKRKSVKKAVHQNSVSNFMNYENDNMNTDLRREVQIRNNFNNNSVGPVIDDFPDDMDFDEEIEFMEDEANIRTETVERQEKQAKRSANSVNKNQAKHTASVHLSANSVNNRNEEMLPDIHALTNTGFHRTGNADQNATNSRIGSNVSSGTTESAVTARHVDSTSASVVSASTAGTKDTISGRSSRPGGQTQQRTAESVRVKQEPAEIAEKTEVKSQNSYIQDEYPFTYISKVMALPKQEFPTVHTVKAYISTLTSRLSSDTGRWALACKINDGTMAVDVDISDQVLTQMIGFSCQESQVMRVKAKQDSRVKEKLKKGIQEFQQKLVNLMCLLELEVSSRHLRPVVVATKPVTDNHIDMLYNRVMANWSKFGDT